MSGLWSIKSARRDYRSNSREQTCSRSPAAEVLAKIESMKSRRAEDFLNPHKMAGGIVLKFVHRHIDLDWWTCVEAKKSVSRNMKPVAIGNWQPTRSKSQAEHCPPQPLRPRPLCNFCKSNYGACLSKQLKPIWIDKHFLDCGRPDDATWIEPVARRLGHYLCHCIWAARCLASSARKMYCRSRVASNAF